MSDFTIIRRSMVARSFSTITTVVTVGIAVALMLVLISMRDSGRRAFERGPGNMHLLVSRDDSPLVAILNGVFYANAPRRSIEWTKFQELTNPRNLPLEWAIPTQIGDNYRGYPVLSTTPEIFSQFKPAVGEEWVFTSGGAFDEPFGVVLGSTVAAETGLGVGDELHLSHNLRGPDDRANAGGGAEPADEEDDEHDDEHEDDHHDEDEQGHDPHAHDEFEFHVAGILAPTGGPHDRAVVANLIGAWIIHAHDRREDAAGGAEIELTTEADLTDEDRLITGIYLRVPTRGGEAGAILPVVFDRLRRDPSITVANPKQEIDKLFTIVGNIDRIFLGMAGVVMLASAIGIMLALYNSMEQRRRQVATLRVLGASRGRIFGLVITESAMIGLLGAVVGVALAFVGLEVVTELMRRELQLVIEPIVTPLVVLLLTLASVGLASLAGIVPAVMAYRTPVAKNLRPLG
ncbi:MAG: ABC transporter permease [Phycisphaerales bacterium]